MFWGPTILIIGSVICFSSLTEHHVTAIVLDSGTCGQQSGAPGGPKCNHQIRYTLGTRTYTAFVTAVPSGSIHGPFRHRTLVVAYDSGYESQPRIDNSSQGLYLIVPAIGATLTGIALVWRRALRTEPSPSNELDQSERVQAQWAIDPAGRHQYRYWDGSTWTPNVADNGEVGIDQLS
jgi:Protein of unknown function (DUF2510)